VITADVVIVGGGPAGCAAALTLQNQGLSTVVVCDPNSSQRPTETSPPQLAGLLRTFGAEDALTACEPCLGICSSWGRMTPVLQSSMMNPLGHPWFIHRNRFDLLLQQTARCSGARWLEARALKVEFATDNVSVSTTHEIIQAHWFVAATGSPSSAGRLVRTRPRTVDSLIAFWAPLPAQVKERFLFLEPADKGWWYLCPGEHANAFACFVTDPQSARELALMEPRQWNALFRKTWLFGELQKEAGAEVVHAAAAGIAWLPGSDGLESRWLAVGDASVKLDPLGSSGTATALDAGRRAGLAVAAALNGEFGKLQHNRRWMRGLFNEFLRQRSQQYAMEQKNRGTSNFWMRRQTGIPSRREESVVLRAI
jgi:flavin-dependent dehydrogenase